MNEIKVGVIGLGRGARLISKAMKPVKSLKTVAICDKIPGRIEDAFATIEPKLECPGYTDHRKMLAEADMDAVVVCVQPEDNPALVIECLEAGKHLFCDVPLTYDSIDKLWDLVVAVEKSGKKFQMGEQVRFAPYVKAWKRLYDEGKLGRVVYAEGEYLHGMPERAYWIDTGTGKQLTYQEAQGNPKAVRSRHCYLRHPINYLPHDISPLMHVLDDRIVRVSCMGTSKQSYIHDFLDNTSDMEVAVMHTEKDVVMKMAAGFTARTIGRDGGIGFHWQRVVGSKGTVEMPRANSDHGKLYLVDHMDDMKPAEIDWEFDKAGMTTEMLNSGHGGLDCQPFFAFADTVANDRPSHCDIYKSCEITAPGIIAGHSAEQGGMPLDVPDFHPGPNRKSGEYPAGYGAK